MQELSYLLGGQIRRFWGPLLARGWVLLWDTSAFSSDRETQQGQWTQGKGLEKVSSLLEEK